MKLFEKIGLNSGSKATDSAAHELYMSLCEDKYQRYPYEKNSLGEGMFVINQVIGEYWKPRYLIDGKKETAVEFMDSNTTLKTVCHDDIDWSTLEGLPREVVERASRLNAVFPTFVKGYHNGVAEMSWQINPDGRYYMDDDGYGMTDDIEITLYAYVDRSGKPLVKFRNIKDYDELEVMEREARRRGSRWSMKCLLAVGL